MWLLKNKSQECYLERMRLDADGENGEGLSYAIDRTEHREHAAAFGHRGHARAVAKLCVLLDEEPGGDDWIVVRVRKVAAA